MSKISRRDFLKAAGISAAAMGLAACGSTSSSTAASTASSAAASTASSAAAAAPAAITLWTYPIGKFGDADTMNGFLSTFNAKYPDITVTVEYLDYTNGDDQVTSAIEAGTTPDVIMEGPERLVSNWGAKGKMVDISDLWTSEATSDISATNANVVTACKWTDGAYYEYPLCMTTHCMAINQEAFEAADALQYINDDGTWTTDNFKKALAAVKAKGGVQETGVVYCGGQGGDQGTRALVTNLYGAQFTNADHTAYTIDSDAGKKGLQFLVDECTAGDLSFDTAIAAAEELQLFANGTIAMTLAWNASNQAKYADSVTFTPKAVAFPSDDGKPELCGGIWGFGIFDNGDDAKVAAAKTFIQFFCDDKTQGPESVRQTGFFPVRSSFGDVYAGTDQEERMNNFKGFMQYLGDYYNVTPGWADQRTAWWNMLQQIFTGTSVADALTTYDKACSDAIAKA
jgi:multiple sugar transport system substrate-binding protein